jgi:hypothetical protein
LEHKNPKNVNVLLLTKVEVKNVIIKNQCLKIRTSIFPILPRIAASSSEAWVAAFSDQDKSANKTKMSRPWEIGKN